MRDTHDFKRFGEDAATPEDVFGGLLLTPCHTML